MDYKNIFKKVDALKEIGNLLNITPDEVDRKLRNINSQYLRETTSMCSEILWHANFATSLLAVLSALYNI
jgi:CBS-domain-containing membrane protein